MKKKITILTLCAMLFAVRLPAEAQQQVKVAKIGWLGTGSSSAPGSLRVAFRQALSEIGYVEGKNIVFEHRSADDKLDRLPALADELVRLKVDVFLASATPALVAAKKLPVDSHRFLWRL